MNTQPDAQGLCILALDFGLRRIGVATANRISGTASALTTVAARDGEPDWAILDELVAEWEPDILVLGLPYNSDGSDSEMTDRVRLFQQQLATRFSLPVATIDERFTSAEAEALLKTARRTGTKSKPIRKEDVDSLAAQLIAESWLRS